jgi:hypothetical protein
VARCSDDPETCRHHGLRGARKALVREAGLKPPEIADLNEADVMARLEEARSRPRA